MAERQRPFLGVHAVNVYVRDQDQSIRFFVEQLGFYVAFDGRLQSGDRWVAVSPPDGTTALALIVPKGEAQEKLVGRPTGIVLLSENVLAKYEEWRSGGVQFLLTPRLRRLKYEARGQRGLVVRSVKAARHKSPRLQSVQRDCNRSGTRARGCPG